MLILKLIRIVLMPVFLMRNRLKGWFLPALARQSGYSPAKQLIIVLPLLREAFGQKDWQSFCGVENSQINLLLTFMNTVDLRLKSFGSKLFSKTLNTAFFNQAYLI